MLWFDRHKYVPCKETGDTGSWVSLQLFGQLKNVLHHDGLMSHALHQGMFLYALSQSKYIAVYTRIWIGNGRHHPALTSWTSRLTHHMVR